MNRRTLERRIRARARGEQGFTLIEVMVAVVIVFSAMTALAYTATVGFRYIGYARDRQEGTAVAEQIMEQIRGLPYATIKQGLKSTDLSGDSNIVSGCGDGLSHFQSCAGSPIISTAGLANTSFVVPHTGTVAAGPITVSYSTYITNSNTALTPYTVTVIVSWSGKGAITTGTNNTVKVQSYFWSPDGCVSSATHPYSAPCQPYFYGDAEVLSPTVTITGKIHSNNNVQGVLTGPAATSVVQNEQVTETSGTITETGVSLDSDTTDGTAATTDGGVTTTSAAADSDPATTSVAYQSSSDASGTGGTVSFVNSDSSGSGDQVGLSLLAPSGDSGTTDSAVSANSSSAVCPPPTDTSENDALACAGSRMQQSGTNLTATMPLTHLASSLGTATLVNWSAAAANPDKTFVNRDAISGQDGKITQTATRRFGTINIGGLPSGMTAPTGWISAGQPYSGYCFTLTGYQDTSSVQAGSTTSAATASPITAGTFYYYNQSTTAYLNIATAAMTTSATWSALNKTCTSTQTINGKTVVWTVSVAAGGAAAANVTTSDTAVGSVRSNTSQAVTPPTLTVTYTISVAGTQEVNLSIVMNLGTMTTKGIYQAPPTAG